MSRPLTSASSLDNLKNEAKRWLKALRATDPEARARLERAIPSARAAGLARPPARAGAGAWLRRAGRPSRPG